MLSNADNDRQAHAAHRLAGNSFMSAELQNAILPMFSSKSHGFGLACGSSCSQDRPAPGAGVHHVLAFAATGPTPKKAPDVDLERPGRIEARTSVGGEFPICTLSVVQRDPSSPINHVSSKPPSHPGQSAFPSPVVDHSCPLMPFPAASEA